MSVLLFLYFYCVFIFLFISKFFSRICVHFFFNSNCHFREHKSEKKYVWVICTHPWFHIIYLGLVVSVIDQRPFTTSLVPYVREENQCYKFEQPFFLLLPSAVKCKNKDDRFGRKIKIWKNRRSRDQVEKKNVRNRSFQKQNNQGKKTPLFPYVFFIKEYMITKADM